jgi:serine/threonine protein kinase
VEFALATIMSSGIYYGRVIEQAHTDQSPQGLIRVEEIQSPIVSPIPIYISRFQQYTEKDCRAICLQIAQCINIMHNAGIAHRNLHLGNVVIDPFVRNITVLVLKFHTRVFRSFSHLFHCCHSRAKSVSRVCILLNPSGTTNR